jgi:hypothetical protein
MPRHWKYSAAGKAKGTYKASLFDIAGKGDKLSFADTIGSWKQEKLSRRVEEIGSAFELATTVAGGMETQSEFKSDILPELQERKFGVDFSPEDYGLEKGTTLEQFKKSQPVTFAGAMAAFEPMQVEQSIWQRLSGEEKMYTFGEGGKQYKQSDLTALGQESIFSSIQEEFGMEVGDRLLNMGEEAGISVSRPSTRVPSHEADIAGDLVEDDMTDLLSLQDETGAVGDLWTKPVDWKEWPGYDE